MSDERCDIDGASRYQIQKRLHVSLFSPADVRERIIRSTNFIGGIVAARPIRTADNQFDLFLEESSTFDFHSDVTNNDDTALQSRQRGSSSQRIAGFGR